MTDPPVSRMFHRLAHDRTNAQIREVDLHAPDSFALPARSQSTPPSGVVSNGPLHVDIHQYWFAHAVDLWDDTFEVESLCEDDLEDLLHVYRRRR